MKIERTEKNVTLYPKVITGEEENLKKLKLDSLSIEKAKNKNRAVVIQRGYSSSGLKAKLSITLSQEDFQTYIFELQNVYDELYGTRLKRLR